MLHVNRILYPHIRIGISEKSAPHYSGTILHIKYHILLQVKPERSKVGHTLIDRTTFLKTVMLSLMSFEYSQMTDITATSIANRR